MFPTLQNSGDEFDFVYCFGMFSDTASCDGNEGQSEYKKHFKY